jgi:glucoamylase
MPRPRVVFPLLFVLVVAALGLQPAVVVVGSARPAAQTSPQPNWLPADKQGFGTSRTLASKVWFTLEGGGLSEVYYPRLDTPSFRDLQFAVDGVPERDATVQRTALLDPRSLIYQQTNTDKHHRWRLIKVYVTDPARSTVLMNVRFQSLDGRRHRVSVMADAAPSNETDPTPQSCSRSGILASDPQMAIALTGRPAVKVGACSAHDGIVSSTTSTPLTGRPGHQQLTLALGFGSSRRGALATARASLRTGLLRVSLSYQNGWHRYLASLRKPPRSLATDAERGEYLVSAMVLAASEDKTNRGAFVASPTMPWAWGTGLQTPSGPYHLVWSRDLYEIATALIAEGDSAGARRALHFLLFRQQQPDGSFPQNSDVTGKPALTNLQLDEVADPIILAQQLGAHDPATWQHVKLAADFIVGWHDNAGPPTHTAPYTPQERWENQAGYSPATIAAEIAGLVCAASIANQNGDSADATKYLQTADAWRAHLNAWTLTTSGPYGGAYYLRLTKDGDPNAGTTYSVGDSGPTLDQRAVVDPSFLELVRLGVVAPEDPNILNTIRVVDSQLSTLTPNGRFWHRYTGDGYGEQKNGQPWNVGFTAGSQTTVGRTWPIFAGERGEYELAAGQSAAPELRAMAATANAGGLLPEQVWDQNLPSGQPGFAPGTPTFSSTPLAWTHAQFIRLAWSIAAGRPVEQPSIVACRYVRTCASP